MEEFASLKDYVRHVATGSLLSLRPPSDAIFVNTVGIDNNASIRSVIIDRRGDFQTEMFLATKEITKIDIHLHPGVDTYELFVAGEILLSVNGIRKKEHSRGQMIGDNELVSIAEDIPHGAPSMGGTCFLSFQHWKTSSPTSAGESFEIVNNT